MLHKTIPLIITLFLVIMPITIASSIEQSDCTTQSKVIYESKNVEAVHKVPYLIIFVETLICLILIWTRI